MSLHRIPLTEIEEAGLRAHGLDIGTPSQLSDVFRLGIRWAQESGNAEIARLRAHLSRYRGTLEPCAHQIACGCGCRNCPKCGWARDIFALLAETPEQSLAAVKAQAVRDAVSAIDWCHFIDRDDLLAHADKLEKESKQ